MDFPFERVYTVTEYYDGPRSGIADYGGAPHVYRSVYLDSDTWDRDEDRFELSPISRELLGLALEDWAIWERFDHARHTGEFVAPAEEDSEWGALPSDALRHAELSSVLDAALTIDPARRVVARGEFRVRESASHLPPGMLRSIEVRWQPVE